MISKNYNWPIRILHILGALDRGGAETMIMNLYRNINRDEVQFDFIVHTDRKCDYTDEILKLGGKIYSMKRFKGYNILNYIKQFHSFFKNHKEYQIVHGHMRSTASLYLSVAKKYNIMTIAHSHNISSGSGISALVKNILQFPLRYIADYFFACSKEAGRWLFGEKTINCNNFFILKNAININRFLYNEKIRINKRKEFGIIDQFILGNVARFHEQKNHEFILDVFFEFLKLYPDSFLVLVGDGEEKEKIVSKVNRLGIDKSVIILNSRNDINELMQMFDIFIFPSLYEGLGIVAIEAQCAALPVLCSKYVPQEVKITNNVEFLPIDNKTVWIKSLALAYKKSVRTVVKEDLYKSGYDIRDTSRILVNFYKERWGER